MNGVIVVNKPKGITSRDVVNKLGRYEDICEDPEELEKMINEHKKRTHQTNSRF